MLKITLKITPFIHSSTEVKWEINVEDYIENYTVYSQQHWGKMGNQCWRLHWKLSPTEASRNKLSVKIPVPQSVISSIRCDEQNELSIVFTLNNQTHSELKSAFSRDQNCFKATFTLNTNTTTRIRIFIIYCFESVRHYQTIWEVLKFFWQRSFPFACSLDCHPLLCHPFSLSALDALLIT